MKKWGGSKPDRTIPHPTPAHQTGSRPAKPNQNSHARVIIIMSLRYKKSLVLTSDKTQQNTTDTCCEKPRRYSLRHNRHPEI